MCMRKINEIITIKAEKHCFRHAKHTRDPKADALLNVQRFSIFSPSPPFQ